MTATSRSGCQWRRSSEHLGSGIGIVKLRKDRRNIADVNGDGIVNIVDLVKVRRTGEMGTGAASPAR